MQATNRLNPSNLSALTLLILLAVAGTARAESFFTLDFQGPDTLTEVERAVDGDYLCAISHQGDGEGAQGWSIGLTADGAVITAITIAGTTASDLFSQGFEASQVTSGDGNAGAVSAVVLNFFKQTTLPTNATSTVAQVHVHGNVSPGFSKQSIVLEYVDGLRGDGAPVPNIVSQDGRSVGPALHTKTIQIERTGRIEGCPVTLVDTVQGVLSSEQFDAFSVPALGGTVLNIKLKTATPSQTLELTLLDPDGNAISLAPYLKVKKNTVSVKKAVLPSIGEYTLALGESGGPANAYVLQLKGKPPKGLLKLKSAFVVTEPGAVLEQSFAGIAGALLSLTLKGKKGTVPDVLALIGPGGDEISFGSSLVEGPKGAKVTAFVLPSTGNYTLRFTAQGAPGALKLSGKIKLQKKRILGECLD